MANRYNKLGWESQVKGFKLFIAAGAAINTNIALVGVRKGKDVVVSAADLTGNAQITEVPQITSDGNVQFASFVSTAKQILFLVDMSND